MKMLDKRLWTGRLFIFIVFFLNVQCALLFVFRPYKFAAGFELTGLIGEITVQGMGILFLMWNVPYAVAILHPVHHRLSLYEAIAMQAIGFVGESVLLLTKIPDIYQSVQVTVKRFVIFDGVGLVILVIAALITRTLYVRLEK